MLTVNAIKPKSSSFVDQSPCYLYQTSTEASEFAKAFAKRLLRTDLRRFGANSFLQIIRMDSNMAVARGSHKKQKTAHISFSNNPFRQLTKESVVNIVNFLNNDVRQLVRLASCDRYFQTLLYDQLPLLWKTINFDICEPKKYLYKMTDAQLHSLLVRVHAVKVTRELRLSEALIDGTGLLPLMNSKVLSLIHLGHRRGYFYSENGPEVTTGMNESVVAKVLTSMLPYQLTTVNFHGTKFFRYMSYSWGTFLTRLNLKLLDQLRDDNTRCGYCKFHISKLIENFDVVPKLLREQLTTRCTKCGIVSCKSVLATSNCPSLAFCRDCDNAICRSCADHCRQCAHFYCNDCETQVYSCSHCHERVCTECAERSCCAYCKRTYCDSCLYTQFCEECDQHFCGSCIPPSLQNFCDECWTWVCPSDALMQPPMTRCDFCDQQTCGYCEHECTPPAETVFRGRQSDPVFHDHSCRCGQFSMMGPIGGQTFMCCAPTKK